MGQFQGELKPPGTNPGQLLEGEGPVFPGLSLTLRTSGTNPFDTAASEGVKDSESRAVFALFRAFPKLGAC